METLANCPFCNESNFILFLNCTDFLISKQNFSIVQCKNCAGLFTNPRPSFNEAGSYYQSEEYIAHSNTKKGVFNWIYQKVRAKAIHTKIKMIKNYKPNGKLLDIGCGTGEFLAACRKSGYTVAGMEPSQEARKWAKANYNLSLIEAGNYRLIENETYDVITLWHVLEHIHDLQNTLHEIFRILKSDGLLVVALPNPTSYDAEIYKAYWAAYDVPRHLYHFSPEVFSAFIFNFGFEIFQILPMKWDAYYVSMLSEKNKTGKINWLRSIFNGWKSNKRAQNSPQTYSSQIYLLRKKKA